MKKIKSFSLIFLASLFFGCKTPPITKLIENNEFSPTINHSNQILTNKKLKIYFPEFYHADGSVINGDGILIILPDDKVLVIDGFMPEAANQYVEFIKSFGITKIDYLLATHYHNDHIGTFQELLKNFEIGQFYSNGTPVNTKTSNNLVTILQKSSFPQMVLKKGDKIELSKNCYIDVLWPNLTDSEKRHIYDEPGRTAAAVNLSSLVLKLHFSDFSIIFPGDIYKKGDAQLSKMYGKSLKADILKAPHHGEWYTANNFKFIKNVSPDYAIIQDNRYITKIISSLYRAAGSKILYRLTPGYILIESDGLKYKISEVSF